MTIPALAPGRRLRTTLALEDGGDPAGRADPAVPERPRQRRAPRAPLPAGSLRVLIVDDDPLFTDMLPRLLLRSLASPRLEFACARDAAAAIRLLQERAFDVLLCDYDLRTHATGLDVLEIASSLPERPFRILFSGHAPQHIERPRKDVLDAFLDKPATLSGMVPLLATLLTERMGIEVERRG
ncbi:MAG TPA: response regulator [Candidatus Thermoplasmatota archaeon]|nr:response regulator [Candidatus Thermoplasmatota archaeon]